MIPRIIYCPKCRKKIIVPKIALQINAGTITINCGNDTLINGKRIKCEGKVIFKNKEYGNEILDKRETPIELGEEN